MRRSISGADRRQPAGPQVGGGLPPRRAATGSGCRLTATGGTAGGRRRLCHRFGFRVGLLPGFCLGRRSRLRPGVRFLFPFRLCRTLGHGLRLRGRGWGIHPGDRIRHRRGIGPASGPGRGRRERGGNRMECILGHLCQNLRLVRHGQRLGQRRGRKRHCGRTVCRHRNGHARGGQHRCRGRLRGHRVGDFRQDLRGKKVRRLALGLLGRGCDHRGEGTGRNQGNLGDRHCRPVTGGRERPAQQNQDNRGRVTGPGQQGAKTEAGRCRARHAGCRTVTLRGQRAARDAGQRRAPDRGKCPAPRPGLQSHLRDCSGSAAPRHQSRPVRVGPGHHAMIPVAATATARTHPDAGARGGPEGSPSRIIRACLSQRADRDPIRRRPRPESNPRAAGQRPIAARRMVRCRPAQPMTSNRSTSTMP